MESSDWVDVGFEKLTAAITIGRHVRVGTG
jgi:hypothetical protein